MRIVIPTFNRVGNQLTLSQCQWLQDNAEVVIHPNESGKHPAKEIICPVQGQGTHIVRQWILDNITDEHVCMLDDDLRLYIRKSPSAYNLRYADNDEVAHAFSRLRAELESVPVAGFSARQGNNNWYPETVVENTRLCHAWAYHRPTVIKTGIRFDLVPFIEDYHFFMSMLKRGFKNRLITDFAADQPSSQAPGGLSHLRNAEGQKNSVFLLEQLHAPFVKANLKVNVSGPVEYRERWNPICYWKKAYAQGVKNAVHN